MDAQSLKQYIIDNDRIEEILENIGLHSIRKHGSVSDSYYSAANVDGDNKGAVNIWCSSLTVVNYTRNMLPDGQTRSTDIYDLVGYTLGKNFVETLKYLHELLGLDYYYDYEEDMPESLRILKLLSSMNTDEEVEDDKPVKSIDEKILSYYLPVGNILFEKDNISLSTQQYFQIGYDPQSNYITIPIRSETGDLIGIKGRIFKKHLDEGDLKYVYLEPCAKARILYGLYQNLDNIINQGVVYVVESEKAVCQLYDLGFYAVATGGANISRHQIEMITRLGVKIIFAYDKDKTEDYIKHIADGFVDGVPVYAMLDDEEILDEKESPSDRPEAWSKMLTKIKQIK